MKAAQLQAYFKDDLSLFAAEEIKKAKQKQVRAWEAHMKQCLEQASQHSSFSMWLRQHGQYKNNLPKMEKPAWEHEF